MRASAQWRLFFLLLLVGMMAGCSCSSKKRSKDEKLLLPSAVEQVTSMIVSEDSGVLDWPRPLKRFDSEGQLNVFRNSVGIEFVMIPAGTYKMGASIYDGNLAMENERPIHSVKISRPFLMSRTEITQKQWTSVVKSNPSHFRGDRLPVESMSWYDIQQFLVALNHREKTEAYRLPTEAEWEYAARAGGEFRYGHGNDEVFLSEYSWFGDNSIGRTRAVGLLRPNPWGLYDTTGNVWEWVSDIYDEHWYRHGGQEVDPTGPHDFRDLDFRSPARKVKDNDKPVPLERVKRGGSWGVAPLFCRLSVRIGAMEDISSDCLGFRLVRDVGSL
jgi:formylglycine-generating enzyme required for sulfatase activity